MFLLLEFKEKRLREYVLFFMVIKWSSIYLHSTHDYFFEWLFLKSSEEDNLCQGQYDVPSLFIWRSEV